LTNQILDSLGLDQPQSILTNKIDEAIDFANHTGWPVVIKTTKKDLLHKSDSGGVLTDIDTFQKLKESWLDIQKSPTDEIQVQKQLKTELEVIVGFKRDPDFGDCLLFGAGGKLVNLFADKNIALFPLTKDKILQLLSRSQIYPLLAGYRGNPPMDIGALIKTIQSLSNMFSSCPEIREMEINPVIINSDGVFCVDTKIICQ
jgi:acetyltransferase